MLIPQLHTNAYYWIIL